MKFKEMISKRAFWKSVLLLGLGFLIIGQFLAAFAYGFIISFGQFRGKNKKEAEN